MMMPDVFKTKHICAYAPFPNILYFRICFPIVWSVWSFLKNPTWVCWGFFVQRRAVEIHVLMDAKVYVRC